MTVDKLIGRLQELDAPEAQVWIAHSMHSGHHVQTHLEPDDVIETDSTGLELWIRLAESV